MRVFLLLVLFTGVVLIILNEKLSCSTPVVEYRYLPRDLDQYLRESAYAPVEYQTIKSAVPADSSWLARYI